MEAQKSSLATISQPQTSKQPGLSSEAIRQFLVKAGEVYRQTITPALVSIWIDELSGYPPEKLAGMFRHVLRTFKADYGRTFPTIADVLEPLQSVKQSALPEEASAAWQKVLAIRREHYNPDLPQYLARALAKLPERVQQAARAAGVFQEHETVEALHVWAKKAFLESYARWDELEESQFLLPDGELKEMLSVLALTKSIPPRALPSSREKPPEVTDGEKGKP